MLARYFAARRFFSAVLHQLPAAEPVQAFRLHRFSVLRGLSLVPHILNLRLLTRIVSDGAHLGLLFRHSLFGIQTSFDSCLAAWKASK
jgi:hypothetical protein